MTGPRIERSTRLAPVVKADVTGASYPSVLWSECVKLITLRSVVVGLGLTILIPVTMAALTAPAVGRGLLSNDPDLAVGTLPETVGLEWVIFGQIGMIVIGVITGSSEYVSRQVKTSLVSVPNRFQFVAAKMTAVLIVAVIVSVVAIPLISLASQFALGSLGVISGGVPSSLVIRWLGAIVFWIGMAEIGFALGLIARQTLIPLFGLLVVSQLSLILVVLTATAKFLPTVSGVMLFDPTSVSAAIPQAAMSAPLAYAVFSAWVVGLLLLATAIFTRRDIRS